MLNHGEDAMTRGRRGAEIYSIFGQIEAAAAEYMIGKGKATKIEAADVPRTAAFNDQGEYVRFAVMMPPQHIEEFERVIRGLRA